jgi:hypothetical protein
MDLSAHWETVGTGKDDKMGKSQVSKSLEMILLGVVLIIISTILTLGVMSRQCHGQCFQTHDKGCQERCFDKGLCPMAGYDQ